MGDGSKRWSQKRVDGEEWEFIIKEATTLRWGKAKV
jgi:hypothetical protein